MTERTLDEQIEDAAAYQERLVPALMEEWAQRVADAAGIRLGDRVLDVACGTGVLARAAATRARPGGAVTGLDLNPGMLAVAARLSPTLRWQQGTAEALPFAGQSFEAVVSQFGLMFVPDPVAALREMVRVLVPGGRLAVAVWGSLAETPAYAAEVALVGRLAGAAAAEALGTPFVLGEPARLAELCRLAGITGATIGLQPGCGRFPSIESMVAVDVRDWLPAIGVVLEEGLIAEILRQAEAALQPFVAYEGGGVSFASPALLMNVTVAGTPRNRRLTAGLANVLGLFHPDSGVDAEARGILSSASRPMAAAVVRYADATQRSKPPDAKRMATERDKMVSGELYDPRDPELEAARVLLSRLNAGADAAGLERPGLLRDLPGTIGAGSWIEPPFFCDYGTQITIGERAFFNFNCVVLDSAPVYIGDDVLIGPAVQLLTATHPLDAAQRRDGREQGIPVTIEAEVWLGGSVIVCPGVRIGRGTVVGAGSVVTRDLPPGVLAVGNPCRVLRHFDRPDAC